MIAEGFLRNLSKNMYRLSEKQDMMSSKKRIRRPSDDPVGAATALKMRREISRINQYVSNAENALTWMKSTETALTNTGDVLKRIKELTVQAANGTLTPEDREQILYEVNELKEQILQEANSAYLNRHVFSGYKTDKPAFVMGDDGRIEINPELLKPAEVAVISSGGTGITAEFFSINGSDGWIEVGEGIETGEYKITISDFNGTSNEAKITVKKILPDGTDQLIGEETVGPINLAGVITVGSEDETFTFDFSKVEITGDGTAHIKFTPGTMEYNLGKADSMTVNLLGPEVFMNTFEMMEELENALAENTTEEISGDILKRVDENLQEVLKYRSQVGARSNRLEATLTRLGANEVDYKALLSNTEDADLAKVITDLKMEESIYRASLAVGARIIMPNLTDFLR
jgi:flagellar hook-associated protein 3 FlgL